ncbi:STAS domain-containing protein [Kitasatospora sp. NBC_00085]|uniref:STAS domain-containing protein n=1 Tax=unclassified Kitasatospora TaxID=2633591 RepID=UPI002F914947
MTAPRVPDSRTSLSGPGQAPSAASGPAEFPVPLGEVAGPDLAIRLTPGRAGRCRAEVRGEIDTDTAHEVVDALTAALRDGITGVDVVLKDVSFCDCGGLNALLELRLLAEEAGKDLVLAGASPQVLRLLDLTDTTALLTAPARPRRDP